MGSSMICKENLEKKKKKKTQQQNKKLYAYKENKKIAPIQQIYIWYDYF